MIFRIKNVTSLFVLWIFASVCSADSVVKPHIDFIHYKVQITPDLNNKSIQGNVEISFSPIKDDLSQLSFTAGQKRIKSVYFEQKQLAFSIENDRVIIALPATLKANNIYSVKLDYSVSETRGLKFYDDHMFTVYHTNNWLVSHKALSDKATFDLFIRHDVTATAIGNGTLLSTERVSSAQVISHWQQTTPIPLYTFGFAVGKFQTHALEASGINISVLYRSQNKSGLTPALVDKAFVNTGDMLTFFEGKSGFKLDHDYTYVVVDGFMAQEASGYSLVGEKFVHTLLNDKQENWFIAHELAHEWWGNSVTSTNFSHFWLNEGLVVFMVAAYKQHLFGQDAYKNEIGLALKRIQRAAKQNRAGPVAFSKVIKEQDINHTMAYSKGAVVFYMLREKLGDALFWQGLKQYSRTYKGKSVTTQDLKATFEDVADIDLTTFFNQWVYGENIPTIHELTM